MKGAVAFSVMVAFAAFGCDLASSGLFDGDGDASLPLADTGAPPFADAGGAKDAGNGTDSAPTGDATVNLQRDGGSGLVDASAVDAPPFLDACPLPVSPTSTQIKGSQAATPPTINGDLSEWTCADWYALSASDAMYSTDGGPPLSGVFAVEYDVGHVYVAWHVDDPTPSGTNTANPYLNDSVQIFVSGDLTPTGDYDLESHNYTIDHNGLCVDYGPDQQSPPGLQVQSPPNVTSAVKLVPGGFDVEMSIAVAAVGQAELEPGTSLLFDTEVNSGDGTTQESVVVWALAQHGACGCIDTACCCGKTPDLPYCDTERLGKVLLD